MARDLFGEIARVLPGLEVTSVVLLGEGYDHVAYEVNAELVARFATSPDPDVRARSTRAEAQLLEAVQAISPPAVPEPLVAAADPGVLVYQEVLGVPLLQLRGDLGRLDLGQLGTDLGGFLTRLHRLPVPDLTPDDQEPLTEWLASARADYELVADDVPAEVRSCIEMFLADSPPAEPQLFVLCHNDLGAEHIFADPKTLSVTGIIDWTDAARTDPACDLALIYRDLGDAALSNVLDAYDGVRDSVDRLRQRAEFYARCSVFEDIAYGLEPGHEVYRESGMAALHRLFPG